MKKIATIFFIMIIIYIHNATCMDSLRNARKQLHPQQLIESTSHTCPTCSKTWSCSHIAALKKQKESLEQRYNNIQNKCTFTWCGRTNCSDCTQYFQKKIDANHDIIKTCEEIASISSRQKKDLYFKGFWLGLEDPWDLRKYR